MSWSQVIWDPTPGGNVEHIEEHDLTTDDVDHVLTNPEAAGTSQSSGAAPWSSAVSPTAAISWSSTRGLTTTESFPSPHTKVPEP